MNLKAVILFLVLSSIGIPAFSQIINWEYENISDDAKESGANPHLFADALGNIHLTYWKRSLDRLVYGVRRKGSGVWVLQDVPDTGTFGYKSALKVNNQGIVYISYLKNQAGNSSLRLAIFNGTTWTFEDASQGNTIGKYGYDALFPTLAQPSLDLNFDAFGQPAILYFNSFYTTIKDCRNDGNIDDIYSQYRMDMNIAVRRGVNNWEEVQFPELPYTGSQPCVENGDRFGEYCNFIRADDSTLLAITTSMHNNELLLYRSTDDSLQSWNRYVIDRTSRLFSILASHFYESFGYIDAQMSNDSTLHLTYNISNHFGYARTIFRNRLTYYYSRINLNRLDEAGYEPFRYNHSPTNLAAFDNTLIVKGDSNITVAFFERLKSLALSANSRDGGQTWDLDTLSGFATTAPFQSVLLGDTIYIAAYFSPGDRLIMAKRDLDDNSWILENVTNTQTFGEEIASVVLDDNGSRKIFLATHAKETDRLLFAERSTNSWDFEEVDVSEDGLTGISICLDAQNSPILGYFAQDSNEIRLATRTSPNNWNIEIVADTILAKDLTVLHQNGNTHLIFFNLRGGYLEHYSRLSGQTNWTSTIIDSSSSLVGSDAKAIMADNGTLHITYFDLISQEVKYASKPPSGNWTFQGLTSPASYSPKNAAIALDTLGKPTIVFADGQKDTLFLLFQLGQSWVLDRVEGEYTDFAGDELGFIVDDQNQPWVLYNYQTFIEDLRLFYRQANGNWRQTSITSNQAEISNSFNFHWVDQDFYIIGKKNQIGNTGLGMLFSPNGILAELEELSSEPIWQVAPNPSAGLTKIIWGKDLKGPLEVELYNLSGQRLYHKQLEGSFKGQESILDLNGIVKGVYFLRLRTVQKSFSKRLLLVP